VHIVAAAVHGSREGAWRRQGPDEEVVRARAPDSITTSFVTGIALVVLTCRIDRTMGLCCAVHQLRDEEALVG
jgi:hypothetical protein